MALGIGKLTPEVGRKISSEISGGHGVATIVFHDGTGFKYATYDKTVTFHSRF